MNRAEQIVFDVCKDSFLSLWSYANPQGKDPSKELCDILVVCEPDIIIVSVKEIDFRKSGDISLDWERWRRRAIEASCKQIYGAERWIASATNVIRRDGTQGLPLPRGSDVAIHRVAVALGGMGKAPIMFGDFGKGFVHVFDELSFDAVMNELDTVTDFIAYLRNKEDLYGPGMKIVLNGGEEDLLAIYLHNGRKFPEDVDALVVDDTLWDTLIKKDEFRNKKIADKESYAWDRLIEIFCQDYLQGRLEFGESLNEVETVTRTMAKENRFCRRILGKNFIDFSSQKKVRSRMFVSPSGTVYVFLAVPHGEDRSYRLAELGNRCFIARGLNPEHKTVIGIATEQYEPGKGFSLDACYMHKETWTAKDQVHLESMQKELGYFVAPIETRIQEDEYPAS